MAESKCFVFRIDHRGEEQPISNHAPESSARHHMSIAANATGLTEKRPVEFVLRDVSGIERARQTSVPRSMDHH